jgi:general secretion pathway protein B
MSFILDALRKSEHERQRSAAPGIANVPFGAPRKVLPLWAVTLMVVLALAVLVLGGAWLRSEWSAGSPQARATSPVETQSAPAASGPRAPAAQRPPPTAERPAQLAERSLARESPRSLAPEPRSTLRSSNGSPSAAGSSSAGPSTGSSSATLAAPTTLERADEPRPARAERLGEPGAKGPVLPSAAALEAEGIAVPKLELQLVAFYDSPADRYVFINNAKYKEGATLAEGPKVVSIASNGAVLSYLGREFMLTQ